ncbi:MAG TPA: transglutaminase family protein [Alphaproteobacteria bacterium]|nr:transglutaminase family protein [Alphaproteobacteria bacterium]
MTIHVALHHRTSYRYDRPVSLGPQIVRLRPAPHSRTPVLSYGLKVTPDPHFINWQQDPHGNFQARLVFPEKTREFTVEVDLVADMAVTNPFDFFLEPSAEHCPFDYARELADDLAPYRAAEPAGPLLASWLKAVDRAPAQTTTFLVELNRRLQKDISYVIRLEPGVQSCEETLRLKSGSCRDSAWLLVQILRRLGFAARFVSGYLIQLTPDVKPLDGPPGPDRDFTDLHAWAEVYLPGGGWIGLDPTSGLLAGEGHIPLAATPVPGTAAPITGTVDECEVQFHHEMTVTRIRETARVTKPYTDEQWQRIDRIGQIVDGDLARADLRLTMGGEPTFVSIDDMDGTEWNTAALGPAKRKLAGRLLQRLQKRFAPGALLHYGQGKWYPGEQLPRWALGCFWRRDGEPVWRDPSLFADDDTKGYAGIAEARQFGERLVRRLQIDTSFLVTGYEDVWHYLASEDRLPVNVDPFESNLRDPEERARLMRVFTQGLDHPVGLAVPLQRVRGAGGDYWASGRWFFRPQRMYLIPGDSPMGFRLPLDSLPWVAESDYPHHYDTDPFEPRGPLPPRAALAQRRMPGGPEARPRHPISGQGPVADRKTNGKSNGEGPPSLGQSAPSVVRTALCVEPREGKLHVFLPPVTALEDYLDLVATVEDTAAELETKVIVEGYTPPRDPRLRHFSVTPDPGVIEVNIQPAASWSELVDTTTGLYEDARATRLGTEKFMLDGRHTGTGGGNHVTLGGPTAADSPFLRRPDLLRSLIGYWHNHPSLSYLFSGLYVGPTSQAPRVDDARNDAVAELELAFAQVPDKGEVPPWLVDRIFRNLLVDVTGNTHRAEFCIDKLYSPDSATGRLGLVEMRAFEMPPHARMSLAQQLLIRALLAELARRPYRKKPIRWNTRTHDRFLLPHFVFDDFADVIYDLREAGYMFERDWFAPHYEFRFPQIGAVTHRGIALELRQAIEPWPVLGEEPAGGGTARYVDSSLERVQVKARNLIDGRYVVTCNGVRVPLHPTGTEGEFVAGVRFRAWAPAASLHPTIGVNAPLVFDLVDTWSERSLGGCTYHVAHPGGRNYTTYPVNGNEAEARRRARFFPVGNTPGRVVPATVPPPGEYPLTLDLRWAAAHGAENR